MEVSSRPGYRSPGFIAAGFFLLAVLSTPKITRWLEDRSPLPVDAEVLAGELDNGVRFLVRSNASPEGRAQLRLLVETGSVHEDEDQIGGAHFVEHMAFNGTEKYPANELISFLESSGERFGSHFNARTSFELTTYHLQVSTADPSRLEQGIEILGEWAHRVEMSDEEVEKERGVIIDELLSRQGQASWGFFEALFSDSIHGTRVPIGTLESLQSISPEALRRFYRDGYRPDSMAVVVVGDFDAEAVAGAIRTHFGEIGSTKSPPPSWLLPEPKAGAFQTFRGFDRGDWWLGFRLVRPWRRPSVGEYRRSLLARVTYRLIRSRVTAEPAVGIDPSRSFEMVAFEGAEWEPLRTLLRQLQTIRQHGFHEEELERVKETLGDRMDASGRDGRSSGDLVAAYSEHLVLRPTMPADAAMAEATREHLAAISLSQVDRFARRWLDPSRIRFLSSERDIVHTPKRVRNLVRKAFEEEVEPVPVPEPKDSPAAELRKLELPQVPGAVTEVSRIDEIGAEVWTLSNGARVYLKPVTSASGAHLVGFGPGGSSQLETEELPLVDPFSDRMPRLYFSTENASRSLFHTIVSEVDQEIIVAEEPSDPEKMFRRAYELLGHSPRLEERIERIRDVFELYARAADTHLHDRILFELSNRHPRRQPMFERFRAFEISEAAAVYRRRFAAASSFTYVLTGDFETEQVRPWILRVLGGLPREAVAEAWQDRGIRDVTGVHSFELPASSLDHALVEVLFYGPATWTPESEIELQALARAVEIFLRQELRERFSLTYHLAVGAEISSHPGRGYRLWIRFSCAPGEVDESMGPLFFGLANFSRIAKLVDTVRAQLLLEHEAMLQSEAGWAHLLRQYLARGQDPRDIPERSVLIERLSARRLRELAEETIDFERYILGVLDPEAEPREDG